MNIQDLIAIAKFCECREREFQLSEKEKLKYYCCKRTSHIKCDGECDECRNIYARYVVIDLRDKNTTEVCDKFIFASENSFQKFQEDYLSGIFFYERIEVRFNIYLIFICEGKDQVKKYGKFASDINYARKLFLTEDEYKEYFCYYDIVVKEADNMKHLLDKEVLSAVEKIINDLSTKGMKSILIKNDPQSLLDYLVSGKHYQSNCDVAFGIKENNKDFIEKYIYKHISNTKINTIGFVKKMKVENFREFCFGTSQQFDFGFMNVIYGINTGGKTSILDAIEYGLVGELHKYDVTDIQNSANVEIEGIDGLKTTSEESSKNKELLKNKWYPYKIGELAELFGRVNYFDTDAAYRFALEQGDEQKAYEHIKLLLASYELNSIQKNIKNNLTQIESIHRFFDQDEFVYRKIIKKKRKEDKGENNWIKKLLFKDQTEPEYIYEINQKKTEAIKEFINSYKKECNETLYKIDELINRQITENLKVINIVFRKLHSPDFRIKWEDKVFKLETIVSNEIITFEKMSTAQKACLALSVIFTQFIQTNDAPRIILLDESVVNFDVFHLLNLFDFLREFVLNGVQVFFTTASDKVAEVAKSKFGFMEQDYFMYRLSRNPGEETHITIV